jgi:hypothetical protein
MTYREALDEAFYRDLIDHETFERFVGLDESGTPYAPPQVVLEILFDANEPEWRERQRRERREHGDYLMRAFARIYKMLR